jgi:hypothetical protein
MFGAPHSRSELPFVEGVYAQGFCYTLPREDAGRVNER